jgi:dihydropteroate synthase
MTLVMGVLNVTPDSFSDGGAYADHDAAVKHALKLVESGADIVDVGGEPTRPGAFPVDAAEEQARVLPVIGQLVERGIVVSIDTTHASTARAAVERGASIVNDVSGGLGDPHMYEEIAALRTPYVLGHWRGTPATTNDLTDYEDFLGDVRNELGARLVGARNAGVWNSQIIIDPGLGFAKETHHNWALLTHLPIFQSLGFPVMIGASRKRFLATLLPPAASTVDRDLPTAIVSVLAAQSGAWAVRVHDVASTRVALNTLSEWNSMTGEHEGVSWLPSTLGA